MTREMALTILFGRGLIQQFNHDGPLVKFTKGKLAPNEVCYLTTCVWYCFKCERLTHHHAETRSFRESNKATTAHKCTRCGHVDTVPGWI